MIIQGLSICTSCATLLDAEEGSVFEDDPGQKLGRQVCTCFETQNEEELKKLFCDITKRSEDLETDINEAMGFIEGSIESYNDTFIGSEQTSFRDGRIAEQVVSPSIENLKTDKGKVYTIRIYAYTIAKDAPEKVGISEIEIESENGDEETLRELFCDISKESDTLEEEVHEAMEFLEGEIKSYNKDFEGDEQTSYRDGKIVKQSVGPSIDDIETDVGKVYTIMIWTYTVYDDHPEKVGISQIDIESEDGDKVSIGKYIR